MVVAPGDGFGVRAGATDTAVPVPVTSGARVGIAVGSTAATIVEASDAAAVGIPETPVVAGIPGVMKGGTVAIAV